MPNAATEMTAMAIVHADTFDRSAARERWEADNFVHLYYVNAGCIILLRSLSAGL